MLTARVKTTKRKEMIDLMGEVKWALSQSEIENGALLIYVPHTTAGVTINENADPAVAKDIMNQLEKMVPANAGYKHAEGNADAHIQASLVGSSVLVIVESDRLQLGTWQSVFFCEFDGPRERRVNFEAIPRITREELRRR